MKKFRGIGITGLAGAKFPWGVGYSGGIYTLGDKLAVRGVEVSYHLHGIVAYENTSSLTKLAAAAVSAGQRLILFGHSLGADEVTRICANLSAGNIQVDIAACFDPTTWSWPIGPVPVTKNVKQCFDFYQKNNLPGGGVLPLAAGNAATILQRKQAISNVHVTIDDNPDLHKIVIDAYEKIAA